MEKKIKFENLIAGALVIFGRIDRLTMALLVDEINNFYGVNINEEEIQNNFIVRRHGIYEIKGETEEEKAISRHHLANLQGEAVIKFFEHLDSQDFTLQKISDLKGMHEADIPQYLSNVELIMVEQLQKGGYLSTIMNYNFAVGKYPELVVTNKGKKRLFIRNYQSELGDFISMLDEIGFNTSLIPEFLDVQNYDNGVYDILNLDNFRIYCMIHAKNMFSEEIPTEPDFGELTSSSIPQLKVIRPSSFKNK